MTYFWIALGSALGGMARYAGSDLAARVLGDGFPWGTLIVNLTGSFAIGAFSALAGPQGRFPAAPEIGAFVAIGLCGGYTTFSSFSLQTLALIRSGQIGAAALNVGGSVVLCLAAVWLGYAAGALLTPGRTA